uniref:C2H2-type domain-containing protein n=1 Tax=Tetraodon nigroviridis TaxID=99883 RepID=H3CJ17_TETNG
MDPVQKAVINHTFGVTFLPTRKQIISCSVCQLRFNSDSQAEAHYKGSRHAKKIKSQEARATARLPVPAEPCGTADSSCQHTELPGSPAHSSQLQALAPHLYSPSPLSSRAGSEPPPSSPPSASPCPQRVSSQDASLSAESEEEKAKKLLYCSLCKVAVNSLSQLEAHNAGSKHKTMLEARSGAPLKASPRPGAKLKNGSSSTAKGSGLQNKTFHCQICDVHVNSEIQLKQHISSRRHKDRVAGKPSKPKYSPYNKQPRGSIAFSLSLSPQKDLVKPPLAPTFISPPFSPAPSPLTSTLSVHPASLSSSAPLLASFLRPAPGPIRTNQGSILFSPY